MIVACSSKQTQNKEMARAKREQERQYGEGVSKASGRPYNKKYKKWNCQRLESMEEKTKSRLNKLIAEYAKVVTRSACSQ